MKWYFEPLLFAIVLFAILLGAWAGYTDANSRWRKECIARGVARYVLDSNQDPDFQWLP